MNEKKGAEGHRFQTVRRWNQYDVYAVIAISIGSLIAGVMLIIEKIAAISGGG